MHYGILLMCHCEERSDVAISGRQLRFRRSLPVIQPCTARLPRSLWGLAMTIRDQSCFYVHRYESPVHRRERHAAPLQGSPHNVRIDFSPGVCYTFSENQKETEVLLWIRKLLPPCSSRT